VINKSRYFNYYKGAADDFAGCVERLGEGDLGRWLGGGEHQGVVRWCQDQQDFHGEVSVRVGKGNAAGKNALFMRDNLFLYIVYTL